MMPRIVWCMTATMMLDMQAAIIRCRSKHDGPHRPLPKARLNLSQPRLTQGAIFVFRDAFATHKFKLDLEPWSGGR